MQMQQPSQFSTTGNPPKKITIKKKDKKKNKYSPSKKEETKDNDFSEFMQ